MKAIVALHFFFKSRLKQMLITTGSLIKEPIMEILSINLDVSEQVNNDYKPPHLN